MNFNDLFQEMTLVHLSDINSVKRGLSNSHAPILTSALATELAPAQGGLTFIVTRISCMRIVIFRNILYIFVAQEHLTKVECI